MRTSTVFVGLALGAAALVGPPALAAPGDHGEPCHTGAHAEGDNGRDPGVDPAPIVHQATDGRAYVWGDPANGGAAGARENDDYVEVEGGSDEPGYGALQGSWDDVGIEGRTEISRTHLDVCGNGGSTQVHQDLPLGFVP